MNLFKLNFSIKDILNSILSVISVSIIITLFVAVYILGMMQGYVAGKKRGEEQLIAYLNQEKVQVSVSPTISPTPQAKPTSLPRPTSVQKIDWGGPELWEAVNKKRGELGVNPLQQRDELCTIASIRLNELLELGKLDGHEGFSNMLERRSDLKWIFEKYSTLAEFLAVGGDTPEETVALWENTLGHKKLLEGGEFVWGCIYAQNTFAVAITAY
ncbi:hypothetical protein A2715_00290 [Candidatus Woesebacteria bacterium RIFCSPHIGHO2_01_FULL_39_32]|uniref:SCP domain-containing protein n=2 Tax=Candidatus Woeseibacteriota TaxID=1752722 RepID=A0A0G0S7A6_9BACT|nr:MAG: hypothetical protein UT61_C0004G0037 [Candidatus Woesebacteria bacterium GW2011_GWA1_39_8]OGM03799.1 MAG: hypothetical protein A2124_00410 [Candidatus Woesebacteria bacterium GWB1_37_5]OGM24264.1 MAG: hypothetical protein A2715_00290 [Candidatus Woesebacteria bacterium RIFCSPHIGHO2_01_FULL_39_32]OGM35391.1 MAG: hypothetical protein A3F01_04645 [Candidatus Woesebacteria bacterium RIFCSPHIGHO2_12_FULL_38_11]OGM65335.1 MAG: hypothetical protein A2893_01245 [Candidatus Woesebacteria bacteri